MGAKTKIDWCDARRNKITTKQGYILIWKPGHPNSNKGKQKGYVFEHRLVMSEHLGRPLESGEVVHHINGNKSDNRIENLELLTNVEHMRKHGLMMEQGHKDAFIAGGMAYARSRKKSRELVPCACGCGEMIEQHDTKGRLRVFKHGHNARGTHWTWKKGAAVNGT